MVAEDDADLEGLGKIGEISDKMTTEALFWRLVCNLRLSLKELDSWTLGEMRMADAYMKMQNNYKRIMPVYYRMQGKDGEEVTDNGDV